ncbi:hypothetical protein PpBr36_02593 [Pyricularia pennisetigena]|uniref:hypothetical protein n=1 Tax=Pyricularia pennisetigena TaxID=1578925 RepID=UPI001154EE06|nr:hypothetical protein PpBr36_02593 [Pyricularia pennisetigena]TLS30910.1 hypothetical protein PpBr36_02593 [Pyricularia pennisetigena]
MARPNALFNHIALSVPDAQAAVDWYTKLFGLEVLVPVITQKATDPDGPTLRKIYGPQANEMKMAILSCGNDVGLEIFEFVDPPYSGPNPKTEWNAHAYTRGGAFHFSLTVQNVDEKVDEVVKAGGSVIGEVIELAPGTRVCYTQDPWGNVVELLDLTINQLYLKVFAGGARG